PSVQCAGTRKASAPSGRATSLNALSMRGPYSSTVPRVHPGRISAYIKARMANAAAEPESELTRARDLGIDTCGRIAEFWRVTRTRGRALGPLYRAGEPLPQSEIQKRLGISAGSASMTLAALGRWGVVHRVWVRGQRREHYRAETDFWKMISGVLN